MLNIAIIIFLILGFSVLWFYLIFTTYNKYIIRHLIKDTPTSKIRSAAIGLVELNGKVIADKYLETPFSKQNCVYYEYLKQVFYRTNKSAGWRTLAHEKKHIDYYIYDETGKIKIKADEVKYVVSPKIAKLVLAPRFSVKQIFEILKNPIITPEQQGSIENKEIKDIEIKNGKVNEFGYYYPGDLRIIERFLEPDNQVYVIGTLGNEDNSDQHIIKKGKYEKTCFVSDSSEEQILKKYNLEFILLLIVTIIITSLPLIYILKLVISG